MRILVISNLYPPEVLGGYEILCHQVCQMLEQRGHDILVLTSGSDEGQSEGVIRNLWLTQPFDQVARRSRWRNWVCHRHNSSQTRQVFRQYRPDVVFFWSQLRLTLGSLWAVHASGCPALYTLNDDHLKGYLGTPWSFSPRAAVGWLLDRTVGRYLTLAHTPLPETLAISQKLKDDLLGLGVPVAEAKVVYQGIPIERFPLKPNPGQRSDPARLLYVGQLHHYKGVHTILQALKRSTHRVHLTIVGAGEPEYQRHLEVLSEGLDVTFAGRLGHEQLAEVYREHDLFIFPSIWAEPFGLTHLEAMASGLPLISTVNGGQGEFLRPGENCLAFEPEDSETLAIEIDRLLSDHELRHRLCDQGRQTVEQGFTLQRYLDELEAELVRVAGL